MAILSRSALASCSYDGVFILYYQDTDGIIRESRHYSDGSWCITEILGSKWDVMLNTPLAVSCFWGLNSWEIYLYYLDTASRISSIHWTSTTSKWYYVEIIDINGKHFLAAHFSKLACASFIHPNDSYNRQNCVYFQSPDLHLREIVRVSNMAPGRWQFGDKALNRKILSGSSLAAGSNPDIKSITLWVYFQDENCIFREIFWNPFYNWAIGIFNTGDFKYLPGSSISCAVYGEYQHRVHTITATNEIVESYHSNDLWITTKIGVKATQYTDTALLVWGNPSFDLQLRLVHQLPNGHVERLLFVNNNWNNAGAMIIATP